MNHVTPGASWMQQTLFVIAMWFAFVLAVAALIWVCRTLADHRRYVRQRDAMFAELALIVLDPTRGRSS